MMPLLPLLPVLPLPEGCRRTRVPRRQVYGGATNLQPEAGHLGRRLARRGQCALALRALVVPVVVAQRGARNRLVVGQGSLAEPHMDRRRLQRMLVLLPQLEQVVAWQLSVELAFLRRGNLLAMAFELQVQQYRPLRPCFRPSWKDLRIGRRPRSCQHCASVVQRHRGSLRHHRMFASVP